MIGAVALCVVASACGRTAPTHEAAAPAPSPLTAYLAPPQLIRADRRPAAVLISGAGAPGATIRLASPNGSVIAGEVDRAGGWRLSAPVGQTPRLYSLSETIGGRQVRATGYLAVLPAPGPAAVTLHPAAAASMAPTDPERGLASLDYDAAGAAVAGGRASAGENVKLLLDGKDAGEDRADSKGAFSAVLSKSLGPGGHVIVASGERLQAEAKFTAARPIRIATPPFDSQRLAGAWRIDWLTPGGGVQSTVLFDRPGARR